ncbi:MAG: hypothetical protein Q9M13_08515 [Mariprofundales bacterium]|nr:hypothetical protein [Mariprofundales bacterium]
MVFTPVSAREQRVAWWLFWLLLLAMVLLIYRGVCLDSWRAGVAAVKEGVQQVEALYSSLSPQIEGLHSPPERIAPALLPHLPVKSAEQPPAASSHLPPLDTERTVGDLIADIQRQEQ